ncbi:MAG: DNA polymerase III subunit beta [Candidatus Yonathbacteria bacterium]|nr:DNA polymerase III subunit beta [Candidatus Yonathbacteria bacterium]NTW47649.1 DNA polymerase III subunit beta [Candidatus Yonathbacteria bacterium]
MTTVQKTVSEFSASCSREMFASMVTKAEKMTGKSLSLPILSNMLVEVKNKMLVLRATNLDIGIEVAIPAKTEGEGIVAIPAHIINGLLSTFGNTVKTVEITSQNGHIIISGGEVTTTIKGAPTEEFPTLPVVSDGYTFSLESKKLVIGLKSVVYASSVSDIKPELASVYIYPENDTIVFVATDSFRLAEKKVKEKNIRDWGGILIPFKNAQELIKVFDGIDDTLDIRFNDHQIVIEKEGVYVTSRIINGTFPDYKQIIPKEHTTQVIVLKEDLINALKVSTIVANTFRQTIFSINPKEKRFIIETKNSDIGTSIVPIQASLSGEEIDISVNYKYITDAFQAISTDSLQMSFFGKGRPIIITPIGDVSFMYLVMPMNR